MINPKLYILDFFHWYFSYYTNWILTSLVIYLLYQNIDINSIIFLTNIGFVGGFYICYVNPRYIQIPYFDGIKLSGIYLYICDFIFHTLPNLYLKYYINYNNIKINLFDIPYYFIIITTIYLLLNDPRIKYYISTLDFLIISIISIILIYIYI